MHKTECIIILQALIMTPVVYMRSSLDDYERHYETTYEELNNDQELLSLEVNLYVNSYTRCRLQNKYR